jgi:hypothetical protein
MTIPVALWTLALSVTQYIDGEKAVISITDKEPGLAAETSPTAGKEPRLTVTGLDEKGQMFRESAPILELDGRDCHFRSKFQPELGSWVLVEFDLSKAGSKRTTLQGQVKSVQPEGLAGNAYRIYIELESVQSLKIAPAPQPPKVAAPALQPPSPAAPLAPPVPPASKVEAIRTTKEAPLEPLTRVKPALDAVKPNFPEALPTSKTATPMSQEPFAPKLQTEAAESGRGAGNAGVAQEIKLQLAALKDSLREELEGTVQRTVSSSVEPIVRQSVEKQIAANYQSSIQTLNSDLTYQLAGRLAGNEELRGSIEKMAKKALEDLLGEARNSVIEEQRNLKASLAETTLSFEKSVAEIEKKMATLDAAATAKLERAQALEREIGESNERLQKVVDQLNQSVRATIEKFDGHVTAQLNSWSAQFKNHVDGITREKAAQFTSGLEQQISSQLGEANEVLEKLSAGLQLARGAARIQETQWAERSRELAENLDKEIKSALFRLAEKM